MIQCFDEKVGGFRDTLNSKHSPDVISTALGVLALEELELRATLQTTRFRAATRFLDEHAKTFAEIRMAAAAYEAIRPWAGRRPGL